VPDGAKTNHVTATSGTIHSGMSCNQLSIVHSCQYVMPLSPKIGVLAK